MTNPDWVVVPREATREMLKAGYDATSFERNLTHVTYPVENAVYVGAISAAPVSPFVPISREDVEMAAGILQRIVDTADPHLMPAKRALLARLQSSLEAG